jgi:hypothetical protein
MVFISRHSKARVQGNSESSGRFMSENLPALVLGISRSFGTTCGDVAGLERSVKG